MPGKRIGIFIILVACLIALESCLITRQNSAFARDTLSCPQDFKPGFAAIEQSNRFALGNEISEPILDGWQHEGFKMIIDADGKFGSDYAASLMVDRRQDKVLREMIETARHKFASLPDRKKAEALTHFCHDLFSPPGISDDELSDWDDSFGNQHRGERLLLGEYILQKKGVCEEEAVLLKVISDELALPATLIFGFDGTAGHVWTTIKIAGKDLVYDPTQEIYGTAPGAVPSHKTIRQLYGANFDKLTEVKRAHDLLAEKKYADAEKSLLAISTLDAKALGKKHPVYEIDLERIADLLRDEGREQEAEAYLLQALAVCRQAWGPRHQEFADCLNQLANLERQLGKWSECERHYKQAINVYEKTLGKNDSSVADPLYNLGELYEDQGKYAQAEPLFKRALTIYEETKGRDNEDTCDAREKLNEVFRRVRSAGKLPV